jgi:hypothetical protein
MPVDDLLVLICQLDGARHEGVHVQVLSPVRAAGRGEKKRGEQPRQGISSR